MLCSFLSHTWQAWACNVVTHRNSVSSTWCENLAKRKMNNIIIEWRKVHPPVTIVSFTCCKMWARTSPLSWTDFNCHLKAQNNFSLLPKRSLELSTISTRDECESWWNEGQLWEQWEGWNCHWTWTRGILGTLQQWNWAKVCCQIDPMELQIRIQLKLSLSTTLPYILCWMFQCFHECYKISSTSILWVSFDCWKLHSQFCSWVVRVDT